MADVARLDGAGDSDGEIDDLPTAQRQSLLRALKEEVAAETQALSGYRPPVALGSGSCPCPCCANREDGGEVVPRQAQPPRRHLRPPDDGSHSNKSCEPQGGRHSGYLFKQHQRTCRKGSDNAQGWGGV